MTDFCLWKDHCQRLRKNSDTVLGCIGNVYAPCFYGTSHMGATGLVRVYNMPCQQGCVAGAGLPIGGGIGSGLEKRWLYGWEIGSSAKRSMDL